MITSVTRTDVTAGSGKKAKEWNDLGKNNKIISSFGIIVLGRLCCFI